MEKRIVDSRAKLEVNGGNEWQSPLQPPAGVSPALHAPFLSYPLMIRVT